MLSVVSITAVCGCSEVVQLTINRKTLSPQLMGELEILNIYTPSPKYVQLLPLPPPPPLSAASEYQHPPFVIFSLLMLFSRSSKDHAITQAVWDLLMSSPTECELVRRVRETAIVTAAADAPEVTVDSEGPSPMKEDGDGEGNRNGAERSTVPPTSKEFHGGDSGPGDGGSDAISAAEAWATLLPVERNWHKTVYTLQIIDALLLPASVGVLSHGGFWTTVLNSTRVDFWC